MLSRLDGNRAGRTMKAMKKEAVMPPTHAVAAAVAALVLAAIGNAGSPGAGGAASARCSLVPLPSERDTAATFLVGTALADTVHAGVGTVRPSRHGGHWGPGRSRPVHGQVVRVDSLGGAHAGELSAAFERAGARDVVVVPWDYDPGCEPTYWSRSARWVEPGLVGFYEVRLRRGSDWAGGRPTFDAFHADLRPYPHGAFFQAGYGGTDAVRTRPSLDAREMFSLYDALPTYEEQERNPAAALQQIQAWETAHPGLARNYPADEILEWIRRRVSRTR